MKKPITLIISFILGLALIPAGLEAAELESTRVSIESDHTRVVIVNPNKLKDQQFRIEFPLIVNAEPRISALKPSGNLDFKLILDFNLHLPFPIKPYPVVSEETTSQVKDRKQESNAVRTQPVIKEQDDTTAVKAAPTTEDLEEMWIAVKINTEESVRNAFVLRRIDGRFLVRKSDLNSWRIKLPDVNPVKHDQDEYYPLDTIRGLSYHLDSSDQILSNSMQYFPD